MEGDRMTTDEMMYNTLKKACDEWGHKKTEDEDIIYFCSDKDFERLEKIRKERKL